MNTKLISLLNRKVWLLGDRFTRAVAAQKAAHDSNAAYPHTEDDMIQMELDLLSAQIELEYESPST